MSKKIRQSRAVSMMGIVIGFLSSVVFLASEVPQAIGDLLSSKSTLTVVAKADTWQSASSDVSVGQWPPNTLEVSDSGVGRNAWTVGRAVMNNSFSGSAAIGGNYDKVPLPFSAGLTASGGWLNYEFEVDASSTLRIESTNDTFHSDSFGGSLAPFSPNWNLKVKSNGHAIATGGNNLNSYGSWTVNVPDAGKYVLSMGSVDSSNVAWNVSSTVEGKNWTVYNWGIGSLPGTVDNPILPVTAAIKGGQSESDFDIVTSTTVRYYDPEIATGYDFSTTETPFASILIPSALPGGDSSFELLIGSDVYALNAGEEFDFTNISGDGVSEFRIRGIDPSEGLDPNDPLAFVTGLSFVEGERFSSFQMTSVPEPTTLAMWSLFGLIGGFIAWRRQRI